MLLIKNILNHILASIKSIGFAIVVGIIAISSVAIVIYTFMLLEDLIAWIIKV